MVLLDGCYGVAMVLLGVDRWSLGGCYGVAMVLLWFCHGVARWLL